MGINVNVKGAQFEREVCKWLDENLDIKVDRLLGQARDCGADIETEHFLIEAKRREVLSLHQWWTQVAQARREHPNSDIIPVVCYKQNHKQMQWLIPADLLPNVNRGFMIVDSVVFRKFAMGVISGFRTE
jgi:hypothetical protein